MPRPTPATTNAVPAPSAIWPSPTQPAASHQSHVLGAGRAFRPFLQQDIPSGAQSKPMPAWLCARKNGKKAVDHSSQTLLLSTFTLFIYFVVFAKCPIKLANAMI